MSTSFSVCQATTTSSNRLVVSSTEVILTRIRRRGVNMHSPFFPAGSEVKNKKIIKKATIFTGPNTELKYKL